MISLAPKLFGFSIARRKVRRALVVTWGAQMAALLYILLTSRSVSTMGAMIATQSILQLSLFLGGVGRGGLVRSFSTVQGGGGEIQTLLQTVKRSAEDATLDERETRRRDQVHFRAYTFIRWFGLLLFAGYCFLENRNVVWLPRVRLVLFLLLTIALWTLPQLLILWTEPDMEEEAAE